MKALVIGGTGFIGSHIIKDLISKGIHVRALVRKSSNIDSLPHQGIELKFGNILEISTIKNCTKNIDLVFSAFGILGGWGIPEKTYWEVNFKGVKNLLESCIDRNIKQLIHISSAGVLGPLTDGVVADESFPYNPSNVYERTKCEAEKEIMKFCKEQQIGYTIIRPEFVYGPGDTHVLGLFKGIKTRKFVLLGNGKSLLHPTYIDDLIQGISLCTNNTSAFGKIYLVTGNRSVNVKELSGIIAMQLGVPMHKLKIPIVFATATAVILESAGKILNFEPVLTKTRVKFFTENRAFSYQKANCELGYLPEIDFREGVKKTIRWYRDNGYL